MHPEIDKNKLLELMRVEYGFMERTLAMLSPDQMTGAKLNDRWTVKDYVAHIDAWHRHLLGWWSAHQRGEAVPRPPQGFSQQQLDELNRQTYEQTKDRPLPEVLTSLSESFLRVEAMVRSLSDAQLTDPHRYPWAPSSLAPLIASNTYEHYREHVPKIREWMVRQGIAG